MPEFAPLDYSSAFSGVPQPGAAFTAGIQGGVDTQNAMLGQQVKQYQFARMQQMQRAAATVAQNPTPENISQLSIAFPEMSENFKRSYDMLQPAQQKADLNFMTQVHSAALNNEPEIAAQLLQDRATAMQNAGADPAKIKSTQAMADWARLHPDTFKVASGTMLAGIVGPDKYGETFKSQADAEKTQATTPAAVQEAGAKASTATTEAAFAPAKQASDIGKTNAEATNLAGRLNLDRDKLMTEAQLKLRELGLQYGTPSQETAGAINSAATAAAAGEQSAARLTDLADRMERVVNEGRANGRVSDWSEVGRKVFGNEDATSALKQEYARIVNNQALGGIKEALGGRVTDVDMKVAMDTVPSPSASPEVVSSYLRGVAKLQTLDAARKQAEAEWLAQGGQRAHLGPTKQDITVMGTKVPAGTTFADFSRQFLQQKAEQIAAQGALARAQGRSYLRFGEPQQPQTGGASGTY